MSIFSYDLPGSAFRQAVKARDEILNILGPVIAERRRVIEKNEEMEEKFQVDVALKAKDANGEFSFNNNAVVCMLLGLLFAGRDTSAHAAMWLLIYVLQHPQVYQKAKEEQEMILKQRPSTQKGLIYKEIKQMTYAAKVINETLRVSHVTTVSCRKATTDINIHGYTIPKEWNVIIMVRDIHMDSQIYPNPQQFDPSRWDNYTPKPGTFLSFGMGGRFCPGNELARLEMTILLHHFLLNYKCERLNPEALVSSLPIPVPVDNCLAKFSKLKSY
ncbi:beta-amyrin 11-oxidase-like [Momordica charantia]|uniref:Beta-amyrin 11-oxidase-like n=1 Tax=Momordica charantia TaxID=3673 RepID=A0A6J1CDV4_MOMCH|nr:beta-amyrin 11-oxidase-like [Momordica charantia]